MRVSNSGGLLRLVTSDEQGTFLNGPPQKMLLIFNIEKAKA